jgi:hypothetical protein
MPDVHAALYSPSRFARYIECTASAKLEQSYPNTTTEYAREGTVAHSVAEAAARYKTGEITEKQYQKELKAISKTPDGQLFYNEEMREHAEKYGSLIAEILDDEQCFCPDAFCELEIKVDFSDWAPGGFGTSDCIVVSETTLNVIDFKYGKGVPVSVEGNPQLRLYALGAYEKYKDLAEFQTVRMMIFQPRVSAWPSIEEISLSQLLEWAEEVVRPTVQKIESGNTSFAPSEETCKFCKAKAECRARYYANLSLFEDNSPAEKITPEEAGKVLARAKDIKAWLSDLEKMVFDQIMAGKAVDGWKIVEGRSIRRFTSEEDVVNAMKAEGYDEALLYERKLIPLTQFEANFGKAAVRDILGDYIVKPKGSPTLAPASDKREAWTPEAAALAAFDEEEK